MLKKHSLGEFFEDEHLYIFFGNKKLSNTVSTFNKESFLFGKQTHDASLINVDNLNNTHSATLINSSDGLSITCINKKIAIYTADCIPCFVYDGITLSSLHLGWRSLQKGLFDKALSSFKKNSLIFIGPHIKETSFEVGIDVIKAFEEVLTEPKHMWSKEKRESKYLISLQKIIEIKASVFNHKVISSKIDTFTSTLHNSYRADQATDLRNISFAFLKK